jgi:DNA-binding NarL/FixJ family response regulator
MRILLADDHAMLRSGLRRIIADALPGTLLAEVNCCDDLLKRVRESDWSVLVLDIALGDRNSLQLIPELRELRPHMPIVVLSMYKERQFVVRALRAGVAGYVTKDRAPEELLEAIRAALQHQRYLSESVASQIAEYVALGGSGTETPHDLLSTREYEVLLLLADAHSVSEIAARLDLSVKTISTYRARILEKLGLSSNAQLIRYALQHGLVHS